MANSLPQLLTEQRAVFRKAIWDSNIRNLPYWKRKAVGFLRIGIAVLRDFFRGQISLRATSLVFTTLLSLVPLLAVAFSVLKGFEVHNELQPALQGFLAPLGEKSVEITERIIGFVENVKAGVIGSVGLAVLFYTIISLMHKIERAFNFTWHVTQDRSMSERFSHYLSVILVGPILIFSALGITATVVGSEMVTQLAAIQPFGWLVGILSKLLPYVMVVGAFTFVYVFMPNTKVRLGSAVAGALVAGVLWQSTGWLFATIVAGSPNYTAIYSAFASLIVFMIWLYVSWLILLVGASIAFYHQHPEYLTAEQESPSLSNRMRVKLALIFVNLIGRSYYDNGPSWSLHKLARKLTVPLEVAQEVLDALEKGRLLKRTADDPPSYLPARPLDATPLKDLLDAIGRAGESPRINPDRLKAEGEVDQILKRLDSTVDAAVEGKTLKDLAVGDARAAEVPESQVTRIATKG